MPVEFADADLLVALAKRTDHLKKRANQHIGKHSLVAPFSVGIELLFVAEKYGLSRRDVIGAATTHVPIESEEIIWTAAEALDTGMLASPFDAVHAATALHAGVPLHTTDRRIHASGFPSIAW